MVKRYIFRAIVFLLVFCALFYAAQEVLRYKWDSNENQGWRNLAYLEEPSGSIDVLFIGSSPFYAGITPMILWKESGITSINFGKSGNMPLVNYYQALYALETQTPKLVILDFNCICLDRRADTDESWENVNRMIADTFPSWKWKNAFITGMKKDNPNQDILSYYFPLLRYHSRWDQLTRDDFVVNNSYQEYLKGALFAHWPTEEVIEYDPGNMFEEFTEEEPVAEYSYNYYRKIIDLCHEKGIEVAVLSCPEEDRFDIEAHQKSFRTYNTMERVTNELGLNYYNMNRPEIWEKYGFVEAEDFYNSAHMNWHGSIKLSAAIAPILQADYGLPDHRGDPAYSAWDDDWNAFYADYRAELAEFGY